MGITREIHKKTGQLIFKVRRTGGRRRYDTVTYVGQDIDGNRVEISAKEYRKFITAYSIGDIIEERNDFQEEITDLTRKSANVCIVEITRTFLRQGFMDPHNSGDTQIWTEELDGRIV